MSSADYDSEMILALPEHIPRVQTCEEIFNSFLTIKQKKSRIINKIFKILVGIEATDMGHSCDCKIYTYQADLFTLSEIILGIRNSIILSETLGGRYEFCSLCKKTWIRGIKQEFDIYSPKISKLVKMKVKQIKSDLKDSLNFEEKDFDLYKFII